MAQSARRFEWFGLFNKTKKSNNGIITGIDSEYSGTLNWVVDLDKSWHMIHYLLTGSAWGGARPASSLLTATPLSDIDLRVGPALALTSGEVKIFSRFLSSLDIRDLKKNIDVEKMVENEIYMVHATSFGDDDTCDDWEYVEYNFNVLKEFMSRTALTGKGIIIHLA